MTNPLHFSSRRREALRLASALALAWPLSGRAQSAWPNKPVNLVVPFPPGGGTNTFARPLSAQFAKQTGKTMVIDNRGGAGGTLGAGVAAKAAPGGYTLFMGAVHHTIAPSMYPKLDYDIEKDFVPIALVANVPQVLVVNPKSVSGDFKGFGPAEGESGAAELRLSRHRYLAPFGGRVVEANDRYFNHPQSLHRRGAGAARPDQRPGRHHV